MRVLFVEGDLEFARTFAAQYLADHEVTLATGLAEAQERLTYARHDLLLVDDDLPDGSGSELVDHAHLTIVVLFHAQGHEAVERVGSLIRCPRGRLHELGAALKLWRA